MSASTTARATVSVLVYSDDSRVRKDVIAGTGRRAAAGLPLIKWTESATPEGTLDKVKNGEFDLLIFDAEAPRAGGISLARTLKTEVYNCPPIMILIARQQDAWLANWAEAESIVNHPIDPLEIQEAVAGILRAK